MDITMISNEQLNELADKYITENIGKLLNITFIDYLNHPDYYNGLADALNRGHGLHMSESGQLLAVELGR